MTTGYHRPRTAHAASGHTNAAVKNAVIDFAESDLAERHELPGGELPPDELAMEILAEQANEFTCSSCFLVRHRSQLVREKDGLSFCRDCEG
ncbi:MAG: DUF4193 family protein [Specibacter sp.]